MDDINKSKQQLLDELNGLRARVAELEAAQVKTVPHENQTRSAETTRLLEEQAILAEIGRIITSSLDINEVYERFAKEARKLIGFDAISINLLKGNSEAVMAYMSGMKALDRLLGETFPLAGSGTGVTIERAEATVINMNNTETLRSQFPGLILPYIAGARTFMGVPLSHNGKAIGALVFTSTNRDAFDKRDEQLGELIADQIAGAIANSQLYAALRRAEADIVSSERRLRSIVNSVPYAVLITRISNGQILFANNHMESQFGLSPKDLIGRYATELYDSIGDRESLMEALEANVSLQYREVRGQKLDGTEFWVSVSTQRILFDGEDSLLTGFHDITQRKQTEEALKNSEAKNRALIDAVPDLIFRIDRHGRYRDFHPADGINLLTPHEDFSEKPIWEIIPSELAFQSMACIEPALSTGKMQSFEYRFPDPSSKGDMHSYEARIVASGEDEVMGIVRDVTERNILIEQLHQSQKMEAVGQLAGGVAHDFNNLLSVIMSYAHLCEARLTHDSRLTSYLNEIQKSAERAARLTDQLLAFSRRQVTEPQLVDLNNLVLNVNTMLQRLISKDIKLNLDLESDLGKVRIDPNQTEQILVNLVVNARDAMPHGGEIIIHTSNTEKIGRTVMPPLENPTEEYVMLGVSDTGSGIADDVKARIFEPFFTTKELGKGTGLGLSTCYGIVAQNSGHIAVDSELGLGTTFSIYLPRVYEESVPLPSINNSLNLPPGSETLMVVEDDDQVRNVVTQLLRGQGYTVLEASNGQEALEISNESVDSQIHLVLTDVMMPIMNGKQLAEYLKETHPEIVVLYTSGYSDEDVMGPDELNSQAMFIQKPFKPSTITQKVREILDNHRNGIKPS